MKTLDVDIPNLIKQNKNLNHRTVIVLTGENKLKKLGVVCNFIEKLGTKNILYCYVKDNKKKKDEKQNKKKKNMKYMVEKYLQKNCPSVVRYCLYKETQKITGRTFDICIFQDYKYLTPNIIARALGTVSGGGFIIFLSPTLEKLEEYYKVSDISDINEIYNANRFLKRFTVSLFASKFCICLDSNFNLLNKKKKPVTLKEIDEKKINNKLISLKESLKHSESAFYPLVNICATFDQAQCLKSLCNSIKMFYHQSNKDDFDRRYSVISTVIADRGRGKSAALGLALCAALHSGVSQICVMSPSPENIETLWQYVKLGLMALDYAEHINFDMTTSYLQGGVKAITKVELKTRSYTQVIRYIEPSDSNPPDCDLLCIDEAAAIPLTTLQLYLRSFKGIVFLSSTVSGYEGSGMALSTKLFEELRRTFTKMSPGMESDRLPDNTEGRLYEITLEEPIRFGKDDPIEAYLNQTMCMNYKNSLTSISADPLSADQCHLVHVNRDVLFAYNKSSERVLHQIMAIYSANNHQNSPDDLKSLADNGCTRLLCLTDSDLSSDSPTIIAVIQISYEGAVNRNYVDECLLSSGLRPAVDRMASMLALRWMEPGFTELSGVRIEFIAVAPHLLGRGYGTRALSLLVDHLVTAPTHGDAHDAKTLLLSLHSLPAVEVRYLGFYGTLTAPLIRFFRRSGRFVAVHLEEAVDRVSGACEGIILAKVDPGRGGQQYPYDWMALFHKLFRESFSVLSLGPYRHMSSDLKALLLNDDFHDITDQYAHLPDDSLAAWLMQK